LSRRIYLTQQVLGPCNRPDRRWGSNVVLWRSVQRGWSITVCPRYSQGNIT